MKNGNPDTVYHIVFDPEHTLVLNSTTDELSLTFQNATVHLNIPPVALFHIDHTVNNVGAPITFTSDSYDPETLAYRIGLVADIHIGSTQGNWSRFPHALQIFRSMECDGLVALGDAFEWTVPHDNIPNHTYYADLWYDNFSSFGGDRWYARGDHEFPHIGIWTEPRFDEWADTHEDVMNSSQYPFTDYLDLQGDGTPDYIFVFFDSKLLESHLQWFNDTFGNIHTPILVFMSGNIDSPHKSI
jgi:hypothetical protein